MVFMKRPDFQVPVHDGKVFTWHEGAGCADASDLGRGYSARVWNDAADVGFFVKSHRTGAQKLFVYAGALSHTGDVYGFQYVAEDGTKITVHND